MPDSRWPRLRGLSGSQLPHTPAQSPDFMPAAPWANFLRTRAGEVQLQEAAGAPQSTMRVLGTPPNVRLRNRANQGVYRTTLRTAPATANPAARRNVISLIGEIAAGQYDITVAYHDYNDYEHGILVDPELVPPNSGAFALRVRGTSMTHVDINPGDLVVIQPGTTAQNGDFVVAWLPDSDDPAGYVTLKRFYRKGDHIFLQSATADRDPIRLYPFGRGRGPDRDRVKVQGRVIVVIKNR